MTVSIWLRDACVRLIAKRRNMENYFGLELLILLGVAFYMTWKSGKATGAREERERGRRMARRRGEHGNAALN
jgi:hypothetical protein